MSQKTTYTSLYTPAALSLVKHLKSAFTHKWPTNQMRNACYRFDKAEGAPDGEVILPPTNLSREGSVWSKSDTEILKWLAIHLKLVVKANHPWYRANDDVVACLSSDEVKVTVSDAYLVYDIWLGRKNIEMKFSKGQIAKWVGKKRDPITTEMEIARRQEVEDLKKKAEDKIATALHDMYNKQDEYRTKTREEFDTKVKEIEAERDQKIKELNDSISNVQVQGLTEAEASDSSESLAG